MPKFNVGYAHPTGGVFLLLFGTCIKLAFRLSDVNVKIIACYEVKSELVVPSVHDL